MQFFAGLRETFHSKEMGIELKGQTNIGGLLDLLCNSRERREKILLCFNGSRTASFEEK